MGSTKNKRLT